MDNQIVAAIIGLVGIVFVAFLNAWLSGSSVISSIFGKSRQHDLRGTWQSSWGPLPVGPVVNSEILIISTQRGNRVWGNVSNDNPEKKWDIEGRYDGQFLQLFYFPSKEANDRDFLDYGCYFFKRNAKGVFVGYSTGFGNKDGSTEEEISTDYHELKRK